MCGIMGFTSKEDLPFSTMLDNLKRGSYSFGCLFSTYPLRKRVYEGIEKELEEIHNYRNVICQFRQPTSTSREEWVEEENYPLESSSYYLFGNGVINASFYKSLKDEANNNDLYYILKHIEQEGFEFLKKIEGCFALCIVEKASRCMFLIRKDYPLFISDKAFSSVKFPGSRLLEHGKLLNWQTKEEIDLKLSSVYGSNF